MLEGLNKRQTRLARPSSTSSLFSSLFFERTADFGNMPGVRLKVLDDFSTACAWTVFVPEWSSVWTLTEQETSGLLFLCFHVLFLACVYKWRTRMEPRRPPVCKILLPRWYRAPRLPCVLAGHKTSAPWVIDAYVALLSWLLVLVVFFPIGSSAWQCFV